MCLMLETRRYNAVQFNIFQSVQNKNTIKQNGSNEKVYKTDSILIFFNNHFF